MPVDPLVQAAQANITHCTMKAGYKNKKGGVGKVTPIMIVHDMLMDQASSSRVKRNGQALKSAHI
jgi:hypothetical protein